MASRRCERIVLIVSNPFLGEIKAQLGPAAARAVRATSPTDGMALNGHELARRLDELLAG